MLRTPVPVTSFAWTIEMDTFEETRDKIFAEVTTDDPAVRAPYLTRFESEPKEFSEVMARAIGIWLKEHGDAQDNEKRVQDFALVFTAIHLHIGSMKLLLSGNTVAAGNLFRQVLETIAVALLCSGKDMGVLHRFNSDSDK